MSDVSMAYLVLTFVLVITPGAASGVVLRNAVAGGWRFGVATALGAAVGNSTHAVLAALGLALALRQWPPGLLVVRVGGGLYLAWLGVTSVRRALIGGSGRAATAGSAVQGSVDSVGQGLLASLLNPPVIVFYLVVVPTFVPAGAGLTTFALLAAVHVGLAFMCHVGWAVVFGRVRGLVHRPDGLRVLEVGAGAVLLYLAARTLFQG